MPQFIDFRSWDRSQTSPVPLQSPPRGRNEVHVEEILARREAFAPHKECLIPQFTVHRDEWSRQDAGLLLGSYKWLSAHTTGPWMWNEGLNDDMTRLSHVSIYIERYLDQALFDKACRGFFSRRKYHPSEFEVVAMSRGVMPMLDATTSFMRWLEENNGCTWDIESGTNRMTVRFNHPEMEAAFLASTVAGQFTVEGSGTPAAYVHKSRFGNDQKHAVRWLTENAALEVTAMKGWNKARAFECEARYSGSVELLCQAWGDQIRARPDGRTFFAPETPRRGPRQVPEDFVAYLGGQRETYEAPYLPEALREATFETVDPPAPAMG